MDEFVKAQDNIGKFDTVFPLKDGRIAGINKKRLYEYPAFLGTNPPNMDVTVPLGASSVETPLRVSGEGPIQATLLGAVRDTTHGAVTVRLFGRDGSQAFMCMNAPIHIDNMFGPGGNMYPLPEGLYLDETRAASVIFTDLTGAGTLARIVACGAKYTQLQGDPSLSRIKERLKDSQSLSIPYWYTLNDGPAVLTPLQTAQFVIEIFGDHNFDIHQFSAVSTGQFCINIVRLTNGESIINAPRGTNNLGAGSSITYPIPSVMLMGTNQYPYRLHEPALVFAGERLLVTLIDTSGSANTIYLALGGVGIKVRDWS